MTHIPGTTPTHREEKPPSSEIKLESAINIKQIQQAKIKPTAVSFTNKDFKNWVYASSIITSCTVILLSLVSWKLLLLIFSGPGIGVLSFSLKEFLKKHLRENDLLVKRF